MGPTPIRFTSHALEKLSLMEAWGFFVNQEAVIAAIRQPESVVAGYEGRLIAQIPLDEEHVLRVVYEETYEVTVVTVYPGRRQRYEGPI